MSSDEEMFGADSPTVSDSDSGSDAVKPGGNLKKRKNTKTSQKKSKKSKVVNDSDDEGGEKRKKPSYIEDMASESDDEDGGGRRNNADDDDEDDDDDNNDYENDGFVVDEEDESDDEDDGTRHKRRRKKKKDRKLRRLKQKEDEIDKDDLMLVRENLGYSGPTQGDSEEESDDEDHRVPSKKGKKGKDAQLMSRDLSYRMFGDSDDEEEDEEPARNKANNYLGNDEYESDDIDEFIVDDDEEGEGPRRRRRAEPLPSSMQGPSVYEMGEAEELFGDMESFLEATRGGTEAAPVQPKSTKKNTLLQQFEPSVLKEHMMTSEVVQVREKDMPERYQHIFGDRKFPDAELRAEESEWIGHYVLKSMEQKNQRAAAASRGEIISAIDSVLGFYHDDKLEPPFVQRYCKEYWKTAGLHTEHLYQIQDLDIKWDKLYRKRRALTNGFQRAVDAAAGKESAFVRKCYEELIQEPSERTYQDMSEFFALDAQDKGAQKGGRHRPIRRNFYQICTKEGLRPLVPLFSMNASVLGGLVANVECKEEPLDTLRHVPTPEVSPSEFAQSHTSASFPTADDVMKGARHVAASKVAAEPNVRKYVRDLYRQNACLYTEATTKGKEEIDEFHYCHGFQYLEGMPVLEIFERGDMWLRIIRAEKEGLLSLSIVNDKAQDLLDPLEPIYLVSDADADEEWQTQRHLILQEAVQTFMVPSFEAELHRELQVEAREFLVNKCTDAMRERLCVRPYEPVDGVDPYVVSIWVESGPNAMVHAVALDANGEMIDKTQGLLKREDKHVRALTSKLYNFLSEHWRTHVVVINVSGGMKSMDMGELVDVLRRELGRDNSSRYGAEDGSDYLDLVYVKDDVPSMYSRSKRAERELPEEAESVRAAVGLGRYLRNPTSELCALWGNVSLDDPMRGRELLYLNVHPMQHSLVRDMLLKSYERLFVQVVNKFGVDINMLANHEHTSYQMQFVSGLGPVKAAHVLAKVRAKGFIERRQDLLSDGMVGDTVYRNCAGFVRIRERDMLKDSPLNPLDDTRIHPESYYMAVKMCGDANNNSTIDMYDPYHYSYAVEDTMFQSASAIRNLNASSNTRLGDAEIQDPLSELDLPAYAQRLELQQKGPKLQTLEYIKRELRYPYFDKREKYKAPEGEELFLLINGETKETIQVGMIIPVTLMRIVGDFVSVRLENGMRASLHRRHLPDNLWDIKPFDFPANQTAHAKIMSIKTNPQGRHELEIACDRKSLVNVSDLYASNPLPRYANSSRVADDSMERLDKLVNELQLDDKSGPNGQAPNATPQPDQPLVQSSKKRKKRQIAHPLFQNVNCKVAIEHLREQPVGDVVIRPSSLGTDHLTLTWKMLERVYRHYDIQEKNKPSDARLGQQLVIKDEQYESIDELIARFIDPMNELVDEVVHHKYFKNATVEDISEDLTRQKKEDPKRIPYNIHLYSKFPGCFSITFVARSTPRSCHMEVKPGGFRFFGRIESSILPTLSQALRYFKTKAIKEPPSSKPPSSSSRHGSGSAPFSERSSTRFSAPRDGHSRSGRSGPPPSNGGSRGYGDHGRYRDHPIPSSGSYR